MSVTNILININLSIPDESILIEFISTLESFFPKNLRKGLLKRYSFHCSEYDVDRNIYHTSITQWKQLLFDNALHPHFFQMQNHSFYFDCFKYDCSLSVNLLLPEKQYEKFETALYTLMTTSFATTIIQYRIEKINKANILTYSQKRYDKFFLNNLSIHKIISNQNE